MARAHKPNGKRFWLNGTPFAALAFTEDFGGQKYWYEGTPSGVLWVGLRPYHEVRTVFPAGPRRDTGTTRYWLDGLPFDGLQKALDTPEGFEKFWLNGRPDIGLFPAPAQPGPMPAHCLAP
jgi:hypothetical protein